MAEQRRVSPAAAGLLVLLSVFGAVFSRYWLWWLITGLIVIVGLPPAVRAIRRFHSLRQRPKAQTTAP